MLMKAYHRAARVDGGVIVERDPAHESQQCDGEEIIILDGTGVCCVGERDGAGLKRQCSVVGSMFLE